MEILKICVAQNVGKVRVSRKMPPTFFHAISRAEKNEKKNMQNL